ncbi:hypothetical protein NDU88_004375 [Pleurodeles waltl]|uniref:Uncharacterized protein n=1 Tax=Pleurodeles waltl TaxID=8319 RepID=A0AAV7PEV4_PLEWA|nr:hypothetical protein NDU88_004375 [Pleurodeles waltl]
MDVFLTCMILLQLMVEILKLLGVRIAEPKIRAAIKELVSSSTIGMDDLPPEFSQTETSRDVYKQARVWICACSNQGSPVVAKPSRDATDVVAYQPL